MRRQKLRRAVKRVFTGQIGGEKTDMWQHPQTTSNCCRWQLLTFVVMIPQESGIRASGSINEN